MMLSRLLYIPERVCVCSVSRVGHTAHTETNNIRSKVELALYHELPFYLFYLYLSHRE